MKAHLISADEFIDLFGRKLARLYLNFDLGIAEW